MALKTQGRSPAAALMQFVLRFLGLNGLIAIGVGAVLWQRKTLGYEFEGLIVMIAGGCAVALALIAEVHGFMGTVASHRGAAAASVLLQVALAAALVIGGNIYSFQHHERFDCTRKHTFTLDPTLRAKLAELQGETDIVVYLQHVSFGQRVDLRQDEYDQAAERVIVKKVEDLVEQFKALGPRFHIHILDTQQRTYADRENQLAKISTELVAALKKAPEDSIFFFSRDTKDIQRLGFNSIYLLDRNSSKSANSGKGNLVLIDQGVRSFEQKALVETKKLRVGIASVHVLLGQEGSEDYGMPAMKKFFAKHNIEARDIILRTPTFEDPDAVEFADSRYDFLESTIEALEDAIPDAKEALDKTDKDLRFWKTKSIEEIREEYVVLPDFGGLRYETAAWAAGKKLLKVLINEEVRKIGIRDMTEDIERLKTAIDSMEKRLDKTRKSLDELPEEKIFENRRTKSVRTKFDRLLNEVDLLIVPRLTFLNLLLPEIINPRAHVLEQMQIDAIKTFIKAGKPVMFCLGPTIGRKSEIGASRAEDALERMLAELNVILPQQTILYNSEAEVMAEVKDREQLMTGGVVEVPPATFEWTPPKGARTVADRRISASPLRNSLSLMANALGDNKADGLRIRYARPVYVGALWTPQSVAGIFGSLSLPLSAAPLRSICEFNSRVDREFDESAVFLMTNGECWNEDRPLIDRKTGWTPNFGLPRKNDPDKGTIHMRRMGPFPIGVCLETGVPETWQAKDIRDKPTKVRLAVIGDGAIFRGEKLSPMREKLFLDVSSWLLGREDSLAHEGEAWQYLRVSLDDSHKLLWDLATRAGLPLLFICIGLNVWLVRRIR